MSRTICALSTALAVALLASPVAFAKGRTSTSSSTHDDGWAYSYTSDDEDFGFAVIGPGEKSSMALSDLDDLDDLDDLQKEARRNGVGGFWFQLEGESYIVRDKATVEEAQRIVKPMMDIGREQGEYGAKMGKLGAKMGEIGALQGRMGAMRAQLAMYRLGDEDKDAVEKFERELDAHSDELRGMRSEQRAMAREQKALGKEQGKLGRKQSQATREARIGLRALAERAVANGKAVRSH